MKPEQVTNLYPHLFRTVTWNWGHTQASFMLLTQPPADAKIANVNIVPYCGEKWVIIQLDNGMWEIPGGTLEPGEKYMQTIQRELLEEAGSELISAQVIGAWDCHSMLEQPFRPHLPHPDYFRLVLCGEVKIIGSPRHLPGGENVLAVETCSLETAIERFSSQGREDLAELYQLANLVRK